MSLPTAADTTRVSDSLQLRYFKNRVGNFFDDGTDMFMSYMKEESAQDAAGLGFVIQMVGRGTINSNPVLSNAGGRAVYDKFVLVPVTENWRATWTLDAWLQAGTKGLAGQYDLAKETIDLHMDECRRKLGTYIGGKGWGSLCGIQAVTAGAGGTFTIGQPDGTSATAVPELANRFFIGQSLNAADAEDSGALRAGTAVITDINYTTGVVTVDTMNAAWAVGDYVHETGTRHATAASRRKPVGLEGWLDENAAISGDSLGTGSTTRFNRSDLQPIRYNATGKSIEDALIDADSFAHGLGKPRKGLKIFTSNKTKAELSKAADKSRTVQLTFEKKGPDGKTIKVGYSAFMLDGQGGDAIEVIGSSKVRPGLAYYGPFGDPEKGFKLLYSGERIINITPQPNGQMFQLAQDGVTDSAGDNVQGYIAQGFSRVNVKCPHPNNYMVVYNLGN